MEKPQNNFKYLDTKIGDHTLLILHGFAGNKETMFEHTRYLHKYFRCIYLDLPGHNYLPIGSINTLNGFAYYVVDFINMIKLEKFGIIGYSFGGNVALKTLSLIENTSIPLCLWASPSIGNVRLSPKIMIRLSSILPYKSWDKDFFIKIIHILGANFTKNDVEGMKGTDKKILRVGLKLLADKPPLPNSSAILTVMDPIDPFVKPDSKMKYDIFIKGSGHSGNKDSVRTAIEEIKRFFYKNL